MKKLLAILSVILGIIGPVYLGATEEEDLFKKLENFFNPQPKPATCSLYIKVYDVIEKHYIGEIPFSRDSALKVMESLENEIKALPESKDSIIYQRICELAFSLDEHSGLLMPKSAKHFLKYMKGEEPDYGGVGIVMVVSKDVSKPTIFSVYPNSPAEKADLREGDIIEAVGLAKTKGLELERVTELLQGEIGSRVELTISRAGQLIKKEVCRERVVVKNVYVKTIDSVAYFRISDFTEETSFEFRILVGQAFKNGCRGAIFDLRGNLGGLIYEAVPMLGNWINGPAVRLEYKNLNVNLESKSQVKPFTDFYQIPMVILVDHLTASTAEILAAVLREYGLIDILGEQTFGKGCGQRVFPLEDGSLLIITAFLWKTPNGVCINKQGIEPDVKVPFGIVNGKDVQLAWAIEIVKKKSAPAIDLDVKIDQVEMDSLREKFRKSFGQ